MNTEQFHLLLADDDKDDCEIFREALEEIALPIRLSTVHNGQQLMDWLNEHKDTLPDVLFLDMKMPRKNGFDCLEEMKKDKVLQSLPVVIYATSIYFKPLEEIYRLGALYYIEKPAVFEQLVVTIRTIVDLCRQKSEFRPDFQDFVIRDEWREAV
ncbi:response regulator [Runella slithyformis]|uniref:Response regulator receiver protein n=1 Tax=Runella slithyformis (strain ATCC 29530 / DSM 19594 / LMG 11500 / NCIMB 11436 / LSU 4) TaxID=761193 RepID=A0A7U3ZGE3_RUNSL|nr:response regulator [Runella slithyformis]AEI46741.1 response regulator receiver protein [Runella slithyformis DSM 19594]